MIALLAWSLVDLLGLVGLVLSFVFLVDSLADRRALLQYPPTAIRRVLVNREIRLSVVCILITALFVVVATLGVLFSFIPDGVAYMPALGVAVRVSIVAVEVGIVGGIGSAVRDKRAARRIVAKAMKRNGR